LTPLVIICTKDRPDELRHCLEALVHEDADVLVVDASTRTGGAEGADDRLPAPVGRSVVVRRSSPPLTAQRNVGIAFARDGSYDIALFLDDDVVVEPGYVGAVLSAFAANSQAAGVGAVVTNEPRARLITIKRFFRLWSLRPGAVLPSGRNVVGHYDTGPWPRTVEWLSGCCMSYRLNLIGDSQFDERLVGYSWGEDVDFSFRTGRRHLLVIEPTARVAHNQSPAGRASARRLARTRVSVLHAWVGEHRDDGMRRGAFWWSVFGEVLICLLQTPARPERLAVARGLIQGSWDVLRHGSSRSAWTR
jgi:GT2 family glycosyltransferase